MPAPAWVALITVAGGLLGSLLTWFLGRGKTDAERIKLLVEASATLVDDLQTEIERLKQTNAELRAEVRELRAEVDALRATKERL